MADLLTIGEPMIELSAVEEGTFFTGQLFQLGFGGDTSNVVVAASRLGLKCAYLTRIGDDPLGEILLKMWKEEGVDTEHVIVEQHSFTGLYITIWNNATHKFIYWRKNSAASHLSPDDLSPILFKDLKVLHISGITQAISNSSCDTVFKAIELAKENNVLISYDLNIRLTLWSKERAKAIVKYTVSLVDIVLLSLEDMFSIFGNIEREDCVKEILNMGAKIVVLKMGEEGCLIGNASGLVHVPSYKPSVPIIDTSGAGDVFDAAFIYGLLNNWDLGTIGLYANIAGALASTRRGCTLSAPFKKEIEREFELVKGKVNVR